jgi:hypothetical protein
MVVVADRVARVVVAILGARVAVLIKIYLHGETLVEMHPNMKAAILAAVAAENIM